MQMLTSFSYSDFFFFEGIKAKQIKPSYTGFGNVLG